MPISSPDQGFPVVAVLAVCVGCAAAVFCLWQFCELMRRSDTEFPGRYDKLIWAAAILIGNLLGALAYWLSKQRIAPASNERLRREYAGAQRKVDESGPATAG